MVPTSPRPPPPPPPHKYETGSGISTRMTCGVVKIPENSHACILNRSVHDGKSLIYTENRKGPRTEPCGIPVLISNVSEMKPLKSTTCCL